MRANAPSRNFMTTIERWMALSCLSVCAKSAPVWSSSSRLQKSNRTSLSRMRGSINRRRSKMLKKLAIIFAAAFALTIATGSASTKAQTLTARQVLDKALTALGGKERLEQIQTRAASGKVEANGVAGTYQLWAKAPDRLKMKLDVAIQHLERGFDGTSGWEKRAGVR